MIDESTVKRYKADLRDEIEPQVTELISRAEKGLKTLLKKESTLQTKVRTYAGAPVSFVLTIRRLLAFSLSGRGGPIATCLTTNCRRGRVQQGRGAEAANVGPTERAARAGAERAGVRSPDSGRSLYSSVTNSWGPQHHIDYEQEAKTKR